MEKIRKTFNTGKQRLSFKCEFIEWDMEQAMHSNVKCSFCEKNIATWWCEFLTEGYCSVCMKTQIVDYMEKVNATFKPEFASKISERMSSVLLSMEEIKNED